MVQNHWRVPLMTHHSFRSSKYGFWTCLIRCLELKCGGVLPVCLAYGRGKPTTLAWLIDGLAAIKTILSDGCQGVQFKLVNLCSDILAKEYVLHIKSFHTLDAPCDKCTARGIRIENRTIIPYTARSWPARTDDDFRAMRSTNQWVENGPSPLTTFDNFDLVRDVVIDPMHCIYLGVTKTIMKAWVNGRGRMVKLSDGAIAVIERRLATFYQSVKRNTFERRYRAFRDVKEYKASEFRTLLLYAAIYVFKELDENLYFHLMNLTIACRIFEDKSLLQVHGPYADKLLHTFVDQSAQLYGRSILTINFHYLLHLYGDVTKHGTLSSFSAFACESFNISYGKYIRARKFPVVEFRNRYLDMVHVNQFMYDKPVANQTWYLVGPGLENLYCSVSKRCYTDCQPYFVSPQRMDSRVFHIKEFTKDNFYDVSHEQEQFFFLNNTRECLSVDDGDTFVAIPMLHTS